MSQINKEPSQATEKLKHLHKLAKKRLTRARDELLEAEVAFNTFEEILLSCGVSTSSSWGCRKCQEIQPGHFYVYRVKDAKDDSEWIAPACAKCARKMFSERHPD